MTEQDKVNILLVDDQPGKLLSYEVILRDLDQNLIKAASAAAHPVCRAKTIASAASISPLEPAPEPEGTRDNPCLNDVTATGLHRDYALNEKKYPVWGISPAATSDGRRWSYREYGVKALAAKGYPDQGIITPHVSFLALDTLPKEAIQNIRNLLEFNIYGEYGLYDSLNLQQQRANPQYLALDQGMTLVALCNYLKKGSIQNRFQQDEISKQAEDLLKESFFKS